MENLKTYNTLNGEKIEYRTRTTISAKEQARCIEDVMDFYRDICGCNSEKMDYAFNLMILRYYTDIPLDREIDTTAIDMVETFIDSNNAVIEEVKSHIIIAELDSLQDICYREMIQLEHYYGSQFDDCFVQVTIDKVQPRDIVQVKTDNVIIIGQAITAVAEMKRIVVLIKDDLLVAFTEDEIVELNVLTETEEVA